MNTFPLHIVTPDGLFFDGEAERLIVRTTAGDVAVMARHANYVANLGMGTAIVVTPESRRRAACIGGMLAVTGGEARVIATTFEWAEDIDIPRAEAALARAEEKLANEQLTDEERRLADAARRRATVRLAVAKRVVSGE